MSFKSAFLLVVITLTVLGCRAVKDSLAYYDACKGDAVCLSAMETNRNISSIAVSKAVDANSNNSIGWIVGSLVGNIVAFFTGVYRGKKLSLTTS